MQAIAYYLGINLRYQAIQRSSRSCITDSVTRGEEKTYPLFLKGQDKGYVEYAIYLLNKNVEQILSHMGIPILNLRATLENLRKALDRVSQ